MGAGLQRARAAAKATQVRTLRLTKAQLLLVRHAINIAVEDESIFGGEEYEGRTKTQAQIDVVREKLSAALNGTKRYA